MKLHRLFFFLLILFLPTQPGYHFWPDWTMVLGRRVDYLSPTIFLTDVLIIFILISWLIGEISNIKYQILKKNIKFQKFKILLPILLLGLINIVIAPNRPVALYHWMKVIEFAALGFYIVKTKPSLSFIAIPLSIAVFYSSLIAIVQFTLQHSGGGLLWWLGERTFNMDTPGISRIDFNLQITTYNLHLFMLRPYATFPHPNVLGGFLATALPLLIYQSANLPIYKSIKKNYMKIVNLVIIMLGMVAMLLTFSRSAIVVGMIAIIYIIARIKKRELRLPAGKAGIMNYEFRIKNLIYFPIVLFILLTSYFILHNSSDESVVVREQLNASAVAMFFHSPIFGTGLGNFLVELPNYLTTRTVYFLQPVHNIYLLILSETGVVGLIFFLWLIWYIVMRHETRYGAHVKKNIFENYVHVSCILSLVVLLLLGLVDHYPLTLQQGQLLLTLLISCAIVYNSSYESRGSQ